MPTLQEIREKLMASEKKREFTFDNASYPFWNIPENKSATIRFLPDGDPNAEYFWAQRMVIRLPFPYVKGQNDSKQVNVQVPCLDMWADLRGSDPILNETKAWWDNPELVELARRYYKKRSYVFQGFVVDNPITEDVENAPENPIRRFVINSTIFEIIRASLMNPEIEVIPTDYERGRDFRITRTKRGQYSDYSTSVWSMRERALTEKERRAIDEHNLFNLSEFIPQKPTPRHIEAIREMFSASLEEQPYDPERWAEFYKPFGLNSGSSTPNGQANDRTMKTESAPPREGARDVRPEPAAMAAQAPAETDTSVSDALNRFRKSTNAQPATEPAAEAREAQPTSAKALLDAIRQRQTGE